MDKIKEIRVGLEKLIFKYRRLDLNSSLYNKTGFDLYIRILTLIDSYAELTNSRYFDVQRKLLPKLTLSEFENHYTIVSSELKENRSLFKFFFNILTNKSPIQSETEAKFSETLDVFKNIQKVLVSPKLETAWNESFENQT